MYHESYEDYIRSILGYPNYGNTTMGMNGCQNFPMYYQNSKERNEKLEACYPEIYKVVYPMVCKACNINTKPVTPELIEELTNEIYLSIENDNEINVTINLTNEISNTTNNRNGNANTMKTNTTRTENIRESRREERQFRNRGLQDLIRILLIRELLGRPGFPEHRPPMPPPRPPMRPRTNNYVNLDLYES